MITVKSPAGNPYLPLWEYIPDAEPYVFEDPDKLGEYRLYLYGSHDTLENAYCGRDFVLWSAPIDDISDLRRHGVYFESSVNGNGEKIEPDILYAPDIQEVIKNGKKAYYLYPNNQSPKRRSMVAKSSRPDGPFRVINWSKTDPEQTIGIAGFDPSVFLDDDGRAYIYYGFKTCHGVELDTANMYDKKPGAKVITDMIPGLESESPHRFYEASSMRKIDGAYIFIYARGGCEKTEISGGGFAQLAYAYSFESPLGPFTYGGIIINASGERVKNNGEQATDTADNNPSFYGHNTHGSLVNIKGQWYITYHRAINNHGYSRQLTMEPCEIKVDKEKKTVSISEAQMTSQGWMLNGLEPYKDYPAGISCYHTGGAYIAANRDAKANINVVTCLKDNCVVGYKYFNFGNKSCKQASLEIEFVPAGTDGFIDVYLDKPNTISGTLLGSYSISADMQKKLTRLSLSPINMDNINGKHALFFKFRHTGTALSLGEFFSFGFKTK